VSLQKFLFLLISRQVQRSLSGRACAEEFSLSL